MDSDHFHRIISIKPKVLEDGTIVPVNNTCSCRFEGTNKEMAEHLKEKNT